MPAKGMEETFRQTTKESLYLTRAPQQQPGNQTKLRKEAVYTGFCWPVDI